MTRTHLALMAGLTFSLGLLGCGKHGKPAPQGGTQIPPSKVNLKRSVELTRAEQRALVYHVETVGVLEAESQTDIAAGASGVVDEVLFREGDQVSPESVLVKIDQRRYQAQTKVAEANVARAVANLAMARDLVNRTQQAGQGASAEEKARSNLAFGAAEAELLSARSSLDLVKHHQDRSTVRSPLTGRINQRRVTPGTYVEEKTVIATIADLTRIRLVGYVPETAAPLVRDLMATQENRIKAASLTLPLGGLLASPWSGAAGLEVVRKGVVPSGYDPEFTLLAYPSLTFRARIFYLSTVASPDTHMFECKAEVDTRGLDIEMRPGLTARIRIPLTSNPDACVVPEESVRASERGFIAFVPLERQAKDGQSEWVAKARPLELGYRSPGWVEVRNGLTPGEWLVRKGADSLEDGTPIRFQEVLRVSPSQGP